MSGLQGLLHRRSPSSAPRAQPNTHFKASHSYVNALLSSFERTVLSPEVYVHLDLLVDELVVRLVTAAGSLNPLHLRQEGVAGVFTADRHDTTGARSLGRDMASEAYTALDMWRTGHDIRRLPGFGEDGKGRGMDRGEFATREAVDMMLVCVSELAATSDVKEKDDTMLMQAWVRAGGMTDATTVTAAGVFLAGFCEHMLEHIIGNLARVIEAKDGSVGTAQDLYTAIAENDSLWGFYRRFDCRSYLEEAATPKKRSLPPRPSGDSVSPKKNPLDKGISSDSTLRKSPSMSSAKGSYHDRAGSALSVQTKSMLNAFQEQERSDQAAEFDAMVRGNETLHKSLTPHRLKQFEAPGLPGSTSLPQSLSSLLDTPPQAPPEHPPKLEPRDPRTIPEEEEEEGETVRDAMQGDIEFTRTPKSRTVPGVVLGTGPSHFSPSAATKTDEERRTEQNQTRFPLPDGVETVNRPRARPRDAAPRRQAQDIADFLENTPPPEPSRKPEKKGFKGFIQKLGKRETKDNKGVSSRDPPNTSRRSEPSIGQQYRAGLVKLPPSPGNSVAKEYARSVEAARKQTMTSEGSASAPASASFGTFPRFDSAPPVPSLPAEYDSRLGAPINLGEGLGESQAGSRKPSDTTSYRTAEEAAPHAGIDLPGVAGHAPDTSADVPEMPAPAPTADHEINSVPEVTHTSAPHVVPAPTAHHEINSTPDATHATPAPTAERETASVPERLPPAPVADHTLNLVPEATHTSAPHVASAPTAYNEINSAPDATQATPAPTAEREIDSVPEVTHASAPQSIPAPTADREIDSVPEATHAIASHAPETAEHETDSRRVVGNTIEPAETATAIDAMPPASDPVVPSIPLAELTGLYGLLRHADTAEECHRILRAALRQLGVPAPAGEVLDDDPEARVLAWLYGLMNGPDRYIPAHLVARGVEPIEPAEAVNDAPIDAPAHESGEMQRETSELTEDARSPVTPVLPLEALPEAVAVAPEMPQEPVVKKERDPKVEAEKKARREARKAMSKRGAVGVEHEQGL